MNYGLTFYRRCNSSEVDGEEIEVVTDFSFLGALVECEGRCEKEIRRSITLGKVVMQGLEKIWKDIHACKFADKTKNCKCNELPSDTL